MFLRPHRQTWMNKKRRTGYNRFAFFIHDWSQLLNRASVIFRQLVAQVIDLHLPRFFLTIRFETINQNINCIYVVSFQNNFFR